MLRKFLLLLCLAFAVVAFGYPCFVVPFGSYDYKITNNGVTNEFSYSFKFNGTVVITNFNAENGEKESEFTSYYKLKGNKIIISPDKKFDDDNNSIMAIASIYRLGDTAFNVYACAVSIGVGLIAAVLILTFPIKKY